MEERKDSGQPVETEEERKKPEESLKKIVSFLSSTEGGLKPIETEEFGKDLAVFASYIFKRKGEPLEYNLSELPTEEDLKELRRGRIVNILHPKEEIASMGAQLRGGELYLSFSPGPENMEKGREFTERLTVLAERTFPSDGWQSRGQRVAFLPSVTGITGEGK